MVGPNPAERDLAEGKKEINFPVSRKDLFLGTYSVTEKLTRAERDSGLPNIIERIIAGDIPPEVKILELNRQGVSRKVEIEVTIDGTTFIYTIIGAGAFYFNQKENRYEWTPPDLNNDRQVYFRKLIENARQTGVIITSSSRFPEASGGLALPVYKHLITEMDERAKILEKVGLPGRIPDLVMYGPLKQADQEIGGVLVYRQPKTETISAILEKAGNAKTEDEAQKLRDILLVLIKDRAHVAKALLDHQKPHFDGVHRHTTGLANFRACPDYQNPQQSISITSGHGRCIVENDSQPWSPATKKEVAKLELVGLIAGWVGEINKSRLDYVSKILLIVEAIKITLEEFTQKELQNYTVAALKSDLHQFFFKNDQSVMRNQDFERVAFDPDIDNRKLMEKSHFKSEVGTLDPELADIVIEAVIENI